MDFINTCAAGLEELVIAEIEKWGGVIEQHRRGAVHWSGTIEHGYRACLWSRVSSRVIMVLKTFDIVDSDDIHAGTMTIDWSEHLAVDGSFAVDCVLSGEGPVNNSMFGALRVKDGIVDQFREASGERPSVKVQQPDIQVYVHIGSSRVLIGLDLSGVPLHRRGYRLASGPAPLKESLAAAIIELSGWDGSSVLLDPMCGSGTLLIEAALLFGDSAPGLGRSYFGMLGWKGHRADIWETLVEEAMQREDIAQEKKWPQLIGFDGDEAAVEAARKNIMRAGLEDRIHVGCRDLCMLENDFEQPGHLISNPPYGERLSDKQSVRYLYRCLGGRFQNDFSDWRITMFTAAPDFADQFRIDAFQRVKIFNGPLPCRLISGEPKKLPGNKDFPDWQIPTGAGAADDELSNRIIKNFKQLKSSVAKNDLESYRVYDRDLPQYNVSVDLLGSLVLITEHSASSRVDQRAADERFNHAVHSVRSLFQVGRDRVFLNRRPHRDKGKTKPQTMEIQEARGALMIELPCGSDTGFAEDQLLVRRFITSRTRRRRFLSIFDSGGFATVAAALGGAAMTTTIGGSVADNSTINMNFNRNGMAIERHRIVKKPPVSWLKENRQLYDMIYINPRYRLYSRGKSTKIDMVDDQQFVLERAMMSLAEEGILLLSTLIPSFRLDPLIKKTYRCVDLSRELSGALLKKRGQNFQCWQIEHQRPADTAD